MVDLGYCIVSNLLHTRWFTLVCFYSMLSEMRLCSAQHNYSTEHKGKNKKPGNVFKGRFRTQNDSVDYNEAADIWWRLLHCQRKMWKIMEIIWVWEDTHTRSQHWVQMTAERLRCMSVNVSWRIHPVKFVIGWSKIINQFGKWRHITRQ